MKLFLYSVAIVTAYSICVGVATAEEIEPVCKVGVSAEQVVQGLDTDIVIIRDERKIHEAELEAQINTIASGLVEAGKWSEKERAEFFSKIIESGEFKSFEKEKRTALTLFGLAAQTFVTRKEKDSVNLACNSAEDMKSTLRQLGAINDKQYAFMLAKIQSATAR